CGNLNPVEPKVKAVRAAFWNPPSGANTITPREMKTSTSLISGIRATPRSQAQWANENIERPASSIGAGK
ncbi:MAG: hypothetical protein DSY87_06280, partial [Methylococcus sp.]